MNNFLVGDRVLVTFLHVGRKGTEGIVIESSPDSITVKHEGGTAAIYLLTAGGTWCSRILWPVAIKLETLSLDERASNARLVAAIA